MMKKLMTTSIVFAVLGAVTGAVFFGPAPVVNEALAGEAPPEWLPDPTVIEMYLGDFLASAKVCFESAEDPPMFFMCLIEACVRLIPGVLGDPASAAEESFEGDLLEYPQYTRPRVFEDEEIPEVLLSGDHGAIARWRREMAEKTTQERRPDLWERHIRRQGEDR